MVSNQELEALAAEGLKKERRIGGKIYELAGIAMKGDDGKCAELAELHQHMKADGEQSKLEEKRSLLALYRRVA